MEKKDKINIYTKIHSLDIDLTEYDSVHLDEWTKKKWKKRIRRKLGNNQRTRFLKQAVAVSVLLIVLIFRRQVYAQVGMVMERISGIFGNERSVPIQQQCTVNQTRSYDGVTVTLRDFILTDEKIIIISEFQMDKESYQKHFIEEELELCNIRIYINGEMAGFNDSGSFKGVATFGPDGTDHHYQAYYIGNFNKDKLKEVLGENGKINKDEIQVRLEYFVRSAWNYNHPNGGEWVFEFETQLIEEEEEKGEAREKWKLKDKGMEFRINKIRISPYAVYVNYSSVNIMRYDFIMEDNLGNVMVPKEDFYIHTGYENEVMMENLISDEADSVSIWLHDKQAAEGDGKLGKPITININRTDQ